MLLRIVLIACAAAIGAGCKRPPDPTTRTHVVALWAGGERRGQERAVSTIEPRRTTMRTETELTGSPAVRLEGQLVFERGRAVALRVSGDAPAALPAMVDVTTTPDRTDTFPIRGPLPVHVLSALVRQSVTATRRTFVTLPDGSITIRACPGAEGPFTDATCHSVTGLSSGRAFVWIDSRGELAATVFDTPWGVLTATPRERDAAHTALRRRFDVYSAP
jgi:hypothetical protein